VICRRQPDPEDREIAVSGKVGQQSRLTVARRGDNDQLAWQVGVTRSTRRCETFGRGRRGSWRDQTGRGVAWGCAALILRRRGSAAVRRANATAKCSSRTSCGERRHDSARCTAPTVGFSQVSSGDVGLSLMTAVQ
jgi:hypothetical protein